MKYLPLVVSNLSFAIEEKKVKLPRRKGAMAN